MLLEICGHGTKLIGLAAPSKILSWRAIALHLIKEVALAFDLLQPQLVNAAQITHILHGLRKFEASIDEEHLRPEKGLLGQA